MASSRQNVKAYRRVYKKKPSRLKTFILVALLVCGLVTIPLLVKISQEQQEIRSQAAQVKNYKGVQASTIPENAPSVVTGQILVKVKSPSLATSESVRTRLQSKHKGRVKKTIPNLGIDVIEVEPGKEQEIIQNLQADPDVEFAEPDYVGYGLLYTPNDPKYTEQYALNGEKPIAAIHAVAAWEITKGRTKNNQPIKVAVLDTGVDPQQPDLAGKIIMQKNFVPRDELFDEHGHGTHVAGIIGANTDNAIGVAGTCPDCQLLIGKVLSDQSFSGQYSWFAEGIQWSADNGAKVINMSLGGLQSSRTLKDAVAYAQKKGAVVVAAAGNCGAPSSDSRCKTLNRPWYPANTPGVVAVAATDDSGQKAAFSNYGTWVDVAAPGASILSTLPENTYGYYNGTSQATPYVAGTFALIFAQNSNITPDAAINQLFNSTDKISGTGNYWKYGKINAGNAVSSPAPTTAPTQKPKKKKGEKQQKKKKHKKNKRSSLPPSLLNATS